MSPHDVVVIGAGPAGAASALFLHHAGHRVLLLDQSGFPRDKVCGEFISPAADFILDELGILPAIEALSPVRLKGITISAYEENEISIDYPPTDRMDSLSIPRVTLDNLLLGQARVAGVDIRLHHKVDDLLFEEGSVVGVTGFDDQKARFEFRARVVVDAGGRNCISLRRLDLKSPGNNKIALAAHWQGVHLPRAQCYMHISPPGYTGISQVGKDLANVVLVVDRADLKGEDLQDFYMQAVLKNKKRKVLLDGGAPVERPRTVESLAYSVKPVPCAGLALVGDAMGFIDPFTGEGIYLALESARIAARVIHKALGQDGFTIDRLRHYERLRSTEFDKKFQLSRILQVLIYRPHMCNWVIKVLSKNPSLAETLLGVIGDYIPARKVVSMRFLMKLLAGACCPEKKNIL